MGSGSHFECHQVVRKCGLGWRGQGAEATRRAAALERAETMRPLPPLRSQLHRCYKKTLLHVLYSTYVVNTKTHSHMQSHCQRLYLVSQFRCNSIAVNR